MGEGGPTASSRGVGGNGKPVDLVMVGTIAPYLRPYSGRRYLPPALSGRGTKRRHCNSHPVIGYPGPRGMPSRNQTTNSTIQATRIAIE